MPRKRNDKKKSSTENLIHEDSEEIRRSSEEESDESESNIDTDVDESVADYFDDIVKEENNCSKSDPLDSKFGKDLGIFVGSAVLLAMIIYFLLTLLGITSPNRPLVVAKGAAKPFFLQHQRQLVDDNYDGSIKIYSNWSMSVVLLYSPYSFKSKMFREEFYNSAKTVQAIHGAEAMHFGATNCFDSTSYCRQKYNLKQYPALMAQNSLLMGSLYNGPLSALYVTRWLNRLQNAVYRIQSTQDLLDLVKRHDVMVILFSTVHFSPTKFQSTRNFTKLAFHYLDGDPNTESTIFCVVTDSQLAAQFQLHNEHDVVIVSSDLKLLSTHYRGWTIEQLYEDVVRYSGNALKNSVEFLNLGKRAASTQLSEKIGHGSVLLYFTPNITFGQEKHLMFRETARDYLHCPEKNILEVETTPELVGYEDCSITVKSKFCGTNRTLSFMMIDSQVESPLAIKMGGFKNEMVIAINGQQKITRFIQTNITGESINCLIHQHHNAAENEFVTESAKLNVKKEEPTRNIHSDAIGEESSIKFTDDIGKTLLNRKINVILFSGGVWHSASTSAIAPFHMVANYFKESKNIIDFTMVDVSQTYVPYNLNFDKLPKILITSTESVGLSWTYPEDYMLNHTNIVRFVLSRPGKIFGRLRWLDSCQGDCRKRVRWQMQNKRLQIKRQLERSVSTSMRIRAMIGYYDRMLRMIN